jgi:hypothetical protein
MTIPVGQSQDFPFALKYLYSIELRFWQISDRFWEVAAHVTVEGAECGLERCQKFVVTTKPYPLVLNPFFDNKAGIIINKPKLAHGHLAGENERIRVQGG